MCVRACVRSGSAIPRRDEGGEKSGEKEEEEEDLRVMEREWWRKGWRHYVLYGLGGGERRTEAEIPRIAPPMGRSEMGRERTRGR